MIDYVIPPNSASLHMDAVKLQRALGDSMMNGVKPDTVEIARKLSAVSLDLLNVIQDENAAEVLREANRVAAHLARRVSDAGSRAGFGS